MVDATDAMSNGNAWRKVAVALKVLFWAFIAKISIGVGLVIMAAVLASAESFEALESTLSMMRWVMLVVFAVDLVMISALFRYASVPLQSGAQGRAIGAAILALLTLGMDILSALPLLEMNYDMIDADSAWDTLSSIGSLAGFLTLMASFRALANHLGRPDLEAMAGRAMLLVGIIVAIVLVGGLLAGAARSEILIILVALSAVGIGIWAFVLHLIVIHQLSERTRAESEVATAFT